MVPRCSATCRAEKRRVMPAQRGLSWYCCVAATSRSKASYESCSDGDCVFAAAAMVLMFSALLFIPDMPDRGESMAAVPHAVSKSTRDGCHLRQHSRIGHTAAGFRLNPSSRIRAVRGAGKINVAEDIYQPISVSRLGYTHRARRRGRD